MDQKKRRFGLSEVLFGLIILLAIAGTVPFFFNDDLLGDQKATLILGTSVTFIVAFVAFSVYGRAQKRKHYRRFGLKHSLDDWMASSGPPGAGPDDSPPPSAQTLANIAAYLYRSSGYRLTGGEPQIALRLVNPAGQPELVQCQAGGQPLGLRDVVTFYELLRNEKAAHGEIWSVGGFTQEAACWARRKPINLLDAGDIHAVVADLLVRTRPPQ